MEQAGGQGVRPPGGKLAEIVAKEARKKQVERTAVGCLLIFLCAVGIGGWVTDGEIFAPAIEYLRSFEPEGTQSRNKAMACRDPRNKNTPFCAQFRQMSEEWRSDAAFGLGKN